jgi:predicted ATPase
LGILADLLSFAASNKFPKLDLPPQEHQRRIIEAMTSRLEALARRQPVLAVLKDVHWIDPTKLDVLGRMINRIHVLKVLLMVTFRPEFAPPWVRAAGAYGYWRR